MASEVFKPIIISEHILQTGREMLARGESTEALLGYFRANGLFMARSMKALLDVTGVSFDDAKSLVFHSETWADMRPATEALHAVIEEVVEALGGETTLKELEALCEETADPSTTDPSESW